MSSRHRILLGLNLPWSRYAADFGVRKTRNADWPSDGVPPWRTTINEVLQRLRETGFRVVRWWLLGDGGHYGQIPRLDDRGIWQMDYNVGARPRPAHGNWLVDSPSALPDQFMEDFMFMVHAISNAGLKVLPVLIDHRFCFDGDETDRTLVKGGRHELINDETKRRQFLSMVLTPLVQAVYSAGLGNAIYAWDLINEPEWCTDVLYPHALRCLWEERTQTGWFGVRQANVTQQNMRAYIRDGASIINGAGFLSTVGFVRRESPRASGEHSWNDASLGVTLQQFHFREFYDDLERHDSFWPSPSSCFIGEISDGLSAVNSGISLGLYDRLSIIEGQGYSAAFIWPEHKPRVDPFLHLGPRDIADIQRYVSGR